MVAPLVAAINEAHANSAPKQKKEQKKKQQKVQNKKPDEAPKYDEKAMPKTNSGVS